MRGGLPWPIPEVKGSQRTHRRMERLTVGGGRGDREIATDRDRQERNRNGEPNQLERETEIGPEGCRDGAMETQNQSPPERARDGQKEKQKRDGEEADAERLRRTDRQRDEGRCKRHPTLTELLAGLLGPLRHPGKSCRAPGRKASGHSKLWTSMLGCLPHLPFPFLALSH